MEHDKEAKEYIEDAKNVLQISHGADSPFFRENLVPLYSEIMLGTQFKNQLIT